MEFRFYMPQRYTRQDLMEFNKVYVRSSRLRCWGKNLFRILSVLCGAALFLAGLMILLGGGIQEGLLVPGIVSTAVGAVWLLSGVFYYRINAWGSRRQMLRETGSFTVTLREDGVTEETEKGISNYPYASFTDAVFHANRWFLFLDQRHALILPLSTMAQGAPVELEKFLEERTGKTAKKYK
ncbi:MAG: YcxB family protein [Oscillibacter sp.]|nr:YcxB family protein [Oscillibacter sp.]